VKAFAASGLCSASSPVGDAARIVPGLSATEERRMDGSDDLGRLDTKRWDQLQDMASRFEAAWKDAESVDLTAFLPPADDPLRRVALYELIKTDLDARWRRGQIMGVEAYLEKFPELGNAAVLAPTLIYEEYRVRHLHGDKPPLDGYKRRFPRQFPELQRLVREQPLPDVTLTPNTPAPEVNSLTASGLLRIGGDYKMIKRIGCGGFAEVWQAETPGGFPVAIKRVLRPLDHAEAQLELRALGEIKQLRHSYLLQTRDYGLLDNRLYVVMELADCTLADRLQQCKAAGEQGIPLDELLRYIHEAAEAIDYMHGHKVHHRDIKPKNILLLGGHAKVADFGLARMVQSQRLTVTGSGTAPYMAPEVWRRQVSPHSDQYSLAVSYAELRLGQMPFAGTDMYSLMIDHIEGRPNLEGLPDAEQQVLRKALAKDPAERYPNCVAFVEAIERAVESVPTPSGMRRRKVVPPPTPSRSGDVGTVVAGDTPTEPPAGSVSSTATPGRVGPGWKGSQVRRGPAWVLVGVCAALLLALTAWKVLWPTLGSFQIAAPAPVTLKAGSSATVHVRVERSGFDGPIRLTTGSGPSGVTLSGFVEAGAEEADVPVRADPDADIGEGSLTVRAEAEGREPREVAVPVTVEPAYWRPKWRPVTDTKVARDTHGRQHYEQIDVDCGGIWVRFVLVVQDAKSDGTGGEHLPTFYIMRDKVWNDLYARFASAEPDKAGLTWEKGGQRQMGEESIDIRAKKDGRLVEEHRELPALRMTVLEAHEFARWLGGRLPSTRQWDKASGYYKKDRGAGPFQVPPDRRKDAKGNILWLPDEIAVKRPDLGPMPVGKATCDESPYHCHDMAGNGCEWTRTPPGAIPPPFPLANPGKDDGVFLRGKRYSMAATWLYSYVDDREGRGIEFGSYLEPKPHVGFRVVIELE
jgi:serine/threonine protein kinase